MDQDEEELYNEGIFDPSLPLSPILLNSLLDAPLPLSGRRHLKTAGTLFSKIFPFFQFFLLDNLRTIEAINQPLETDATTPNGEEEDMESINESEELSIIGEDLVNQSLAEVTAILDQQMDLNNGSTSETEIRSASTKRISFLVPSDVPHISLSSADESQMSQ